MTFEEFAKRHNVTIESTPIDRRSRPLGMGGNDDWDKTAIHNAVALKIGDRLLWQGEYSRGIGHAEAWARDPNRKEWRRVIDRETGESRMDWRAYRGSIRMATGWEPLPYGKRYRPDAEPLQKLRALYAAKVPPTVADVLESLRCDISESDQPFSDWAGDLGYSDDSISAKEIWETCNDIRRAFQRAMTAEQFAEFEECEA